MRRACPSYFISFPVETGPEKQDDGDDRSQQDLVTEIKHHLVRPGVLGEG